MAARKKTSKKGRKKTKFSAKQVAQFGAALKAQKDTYSRGPLDE